MSNGLEAAACNGYADGLETVVGKILRAGRDVVDAEDQCVAADDIHDNLVSAAHVGGDFGSATRPPKVSATQSAM
jgi:hypothetical protein